MLSWSAARRCVLLTLPRLSPVRRLNPLRKAYRSFLDPFSKRRRDPFAAAGGARKSEVAITTNQLAAVDLSANSGRLSVRSDASELSVSVRV